jgi:beta-glucosidase
MKKLSFVILICLCLGVRAQVDSLTQDGIVRVLAIGNSFSQDAVEQYLHELAEADGYQLIIGNLYIGGCSLERHYNNMVNNTADYAYRKIGLDGVKRETTSMTLDAGMDDEAWDYAS